jgi:hypothetical protein
LEVSTVSNEITSAVAQNPSLAWSFAFVFLCVCVWLIWFWFDLILCLFARFFLFCMVSCLINTGRLWSFTLFDWLVLSCLIQIFDWYCSFISLFVCLLACLFVCLAGWLAVCLSIGLLSGLFACLCWFLLDYSELTPPDPKPCV